MPRMAALGSAMIATAAAVTVRQEPRPQTYRRAIWPDALVRQSEMEPRTFAFRRRRPFGDSSGIHEICPCAFGQAMQGASR